MHERKSRVRGRPAHSARSTRAGEERAAKTRGCSGFCIRTGFRGRLDEEKLLSRPKCKSFEKEL